MEAQMDTMQAIENNDTYKQILKDSFGGVLYNVANRDKYDTGELLKLWDKLGRYQDGVGGIMKGAINFAQGN